MVTVYTKEKELPEDIYNTGRSCTDFIWGDWNYCIVPSSDEDTATALYLADALQLTSYEEYESANGYSFILVA